MDSQLIKGLQNGNFYAIYFEIGRSLFPICETKFIFCVCTKILVLGRTSILVNTIIIEGLITYFGLVFHLP